MIVGTAHHGPEQNSFRDHNAPKYEYPKRTTDAAQLVAYTYSLDLFFANLLFSFVAQGHDRFQTHTMSPDLTYLSDGQRRSGNGIV